MLGTVTFFDGTRKLCRSRVRQDTASCALHPRQLKRGTYKLRARYSGNPYYARSTSADVKLTIRR